MLHNYSSLDFRIGEARSIRDVAQKIYDLDSFTCNLTLEDWEYRSRGYKPLVDLLENKYATPVVITNGANHALHAVMHALKAQGASSVGYRSPYWNRIPEIIKQAGLGPVAFNSKLLPTKAVDSYLLTLPNNPDGYVLPNEELNREIESLRERKIPLVHDAVYYTHTYLPVDYTIKPIGDLQIFSASKAYGLSSLRVGYIVVRNVNLLQPLLDFIEFSTVGVSVLAQKIFLNILKLEGKSPELRQSFERLARSELQKSRDLFSQISPDCLELPLDFKESGGMFAWARVKMTHLFEEINVQVLPGEIFGMPGYMRLNLAAGTELIAEAVERANYVSRRDTQNRG